MLVATKGSGVFVYDINNQVYKKVSSFNSTEYDEVKILSENYFPEEKIMLVNMQKFNQEQVSLPRQLWLLLLEIKLM